MHLSRISVKNFRNFSDFDVRLAGNVVVVGENRVGKSNLLYGLRLIFDPTLPDSARELGLSDFWDGLEERSAEDKIVIAVEIKDFEDDLDILGVLTDFRLNDDPHTVRLTYEYRPRAGLEGEPAAEEDYEFICYGGEDEAKQFGHELRRRISMDVLPALRDAEGDLGSWRRSPLRPLIEKAFRDVDPADLKEISDAIEEATDKITDFGAVESLEEDIRKLFGEMSGPRRLSRGGRAVVQGEQGSIVGTENLIRQESTSEVANRVIIPLHAGDDRTAVALADVAREVATPS